MKRLNRRSTSPPPSLPFKKACIYTILSPFLIFQVPRWEVIKICYSPLKNGVGGSELWLIIIIIGIHSVYKIFFLYAVHMKIFLLFTIIYSKINMNECCGNNFALAIICQHTLEKIQISLCKSLRICWVLRRILKSV